MSPRPRRRTSCMSRCRSTRRIRGARHADARAGASTHVLFIDVQEVPTVQVPVALHVSGSFDPSQPDVPATQTPVHAPFTHVLPIDVHDVPVTQVPLALQVCVSFDASQPAAPEVQEPVHAPLTHVWPLLVQSVTTVHAPAALHVSVSFEPSSWSAPARTRPCTTRSRTSCCCSCTRCPPSRPPLRRTSRVWFGGRASLPGAHDPCTSRHARRVAGRARGADRPGPRRAAGLGIVRPVAVGLTRGADARARAAHARLVAGGARGACRPGPGRAARLGWFEPEQLVWPGAHDPGARPAHARLVAARAARSGDPVARSNRRSRSRSTRSQPIAPATQVPMQDPATQVELVHALPAFCHDAVHAGSGAAGRCIALPGGARARAHAARRRSSSSR